MPTGFLRRHICRAAALRSQKAYAIVGFKSFKIRLPPDHEYRGARVTSQRSEASGQRASGQHPATFASSGQRPEHQSPEPSTLVKQIGCGMVQWDGTRLIYESHPKLALRLAHAGPHAAIATLGQGAIMRARAIVQQVYHGLTEDPRPHVKWGQG
jgi:hypothetical protein